ncbi:hypothetical protein [Prosthecobacter sp.]|uniref:hypothetical protein n=1 Tax=Prosthecobacter sp. TaxID=1965333 RepID=UPI0037842921
MINSDDHGETKVQYYFKGDRLLFTLDRSETWRMIPKAPTDVVEKRYYFAKNQLIRLLEKKAQFPAGAPADTTGIKNLELPLNADETAAETYTTQHELAASVIERARKLEEEEEPAGAAAATPAAMTGEGWRMIAGTESRDGNYALAWGLKGKAVTEGDADEEGRLSVDPDDPDLLNYVVDLSTKKIIGTLRGKHFGDRARYNHMSCEAEWSGDSQFVVQTCNAKWDTTSAFVYLLQEGDAVTPGTDLLGPAKAAAFKKLKDGPQLKKFKPDAFAITLSEVRIAQRGSSVVLQMNVDGVIPKSDADAASFGCTVSFTLAPGDGGVPVVKWLSTELYED